VANGVLEANWPKMLSILRKARLKDKELRILMLGLDNAGKTTIVKKIMGEDVNTVSPTLGFIIKTIDYEGYTTSLRTDTAGEPGGGANCEKDTG